MAAIVYQLSNIANSTRCKKCDGLNIECQKSFLIKYRSTSSVSTLACATSDTSMAPLQSHAEAQSVTYLNTLEAKDNNATQQQKQQKTHKRQLSQQLPSTGSSKSTHSSGSYSNLATLANSKNDIKSIKLSDSNLQKSIAPTVSAASLRNASPSRKGASSSSGNTAKNEQNLSAATGAAGNTITAAIVPMEKEKKKRKEVSNSRVKKFRRHFTQVPKDEKLINYFSCALVSDILLQGHLYITDQHFAFYSNVFGYVTKVVIPTSSVTKISKEKTAKIIPNAVGVATTDERHVFASFISREAAYRLMCSVCAPQMPLPELLLKLPITDIEISEEYSIEDDSSCSISGNESPPQILDATGTAMPVSDPTGSTLLRRTIASSSLSAVESKSITNQRATNDPDGTPAGHINAVLRASLPPSAFHQNTNSSGLLTTPSTGAAASAATNLTMIVAGTASSTSSSSTTTSTPTTSSSPTTVMSIANPKSATQQAVDSLKNVVKNLLSHFKFPDELNVIYLAVLLSFILAAFSVFLLWRILDIETKISSYRSPMFFDWQSRTEEDIFTEALRWQKELQTKSTAEAQSILNTNLEQIAKVRRSLETLSMLIHDRSSNAFGATNRDDSD